MTTPLSISCPNCGSGLKIKDYSLIGKKVPCPKCKTAFQIAVRVEAAPEHLSPLPSEGGTSVETEREFWEEPDVKTPNTIENRLWTCPWCSQETKVPANKPDPASCDGCRAAAPPKKPVSPKDLLKLRGKSPIVFGCIVLMFFACFLLFAGSRNGKINLICEYLAEDGYRTNAYRQLDGVGDDYYACSPYKDISPNSLNHIAYYVNGTRTKVSEITLDLNVHDLSGAKAANGELLSSGEKMVRKATGNPLPNAAREAIMGGGNGTWQVGLATVRLTRNDYVTGRGYSLKLIVDWK